MSWPEHLSPHFPYSEMVRSEYAAAHGIDNAPPEALEQNALRLAALCERARAILCDGAGHDVAMIPSSGFRCARLNTAVGGSGGRPGEKLSAHMAFRAIDFHTRDMNLAMAFDTLRRSGLDFDKLIWEIDARGNAWIHLQVARDGAFPARRVFRGVKLPSGSTFEELARV